MKVQKLIQKMYKAIFDHNTVKEKKIWLKLLKKSLKHKHTESVR